MEWIKLLGQSYQEYRTMMLEMATDGTTSGHVQSESLIGYTHLNEARMKRLDKQVKKSTILDLPRLSSIHSQTWLILTETWCGDAAQNIPWIEYLASMSPKVTTRYLLRDNHPSLMDEFLTNGSRSIPKLISVNLEGEVLFTWGPRPEEAQHLMISLKEKGLPKSESSKQIQLWYAKDKGNGVVNELADLMVQSAG